LFALALSSGGCAAKMKEAEPPPRGVEDRKPLSEIDALEHDLSVSEQRLESQLVRRERALADSRTSESEGESDASKKTESSARPPAQKPAEGADEEEKATPRGQAAQPSAPPAPEEAPVRSARAGTPCDMACRALSSMRRSADRICALAGSADERCRRARERVSAAEERIRRAQCECVNGGSEKLNARAPDFRRSAREAGHRVDVATLGQCLGDRGR
jgi:hypothetical protein